MTKQAPPQRSILDEIEALLNEEAKPRIPVVAQFTAFELLESVGIDVSQL